MRIISLIFVILIVSCKANTDSYDYTLEIPPPATDSSFVNPAPIEEVAATHYSFVVIITDEPKGIKEIAGGSKYLDRGKEKYVTEVQTIDEKVTDDYKFQELDLAERNLRDAELTDIFEGNKRLAETYKIDESEAEIKILSRDIFIFDSYKEASLARQTAMQN